MPPVDCNITDDAEVGTCQTRGKYWVWKTAKLFVMTVIYHLFFGAEYKIVAEGLFFLLFLPRMTALPGISMDELVMDGICGVKS
jgi:hypothetical protein